MEDQNTQLLKEVNAGCKYATNSMDQMMGFVEDRELKSVMEKYHRTHEALGDEAHQLLCRCGKDEKDPNPVAKAMSWVGTEAKLVTNHDDKKIVKMLMDGCNMGISNLSSEVNKCEAASAETKALAERVIQTEERFMDEIRRFA